MSSRAVLLSLLAIGVGPVRTQEVRANWRQAEKFAQENLRKFLYSTSITPNWIGKTDRFWYQYRTSAGTQYWLVDAEQRSKRPLFDHVALAAALSATLRRPQEPLRLELTGIKLDDGLGKLEFVAGGRRLSWEYASGRLGDLGEAASRPDSRPAGEGQDQERTQQQQQQQQRQDEQQDQRDQQQERGRGGEAPGAPPAPRDPRAYAPDRSAYAFLKEHDLYVVEGVVETGEVAEASASRAASAPAEAAASRPASRPAPVDGDGARSGSRPVEAAASRAVRYRFDERNAVRLSKDSVEGYSFGPGPGVFGGGGGTRTETSASRPAPAVPPSVTWARNSRAFFATRRDVRGVADLWLVNSLAQPRPALEKYPYAMPGEEHVAFAELWVFERGQAAAKQIEPRWTQESYQNPHFVGDSNELRFVRRDRLQRNAEVCAVDAATGAVRVLFRESLDNASLELQTPRYLDKRKQFLWWSERTGYGHFYLHDTASGRELNPVTAGTFRSSRILEVDEDAGVLWFRGKGREPGEDLNYEHLYRVDLDGKGLTCLDPGDAHHVATLAPSRRYVVDNYSRVDLPARSVLRDGRDGRVLLDLEATDLSKLTEMGWKPPERFTVKAADGVTDLFGNLWKPFDFDPKRRYPVIVHVYPGPQQEGVTHTFAAGGTNQQLAQLGFLVVQVGHRGGTPERSKAYASYGYGNLRDYGLEDKKTALEQLADRHPFVDLERVGIFGHSGGGFMTAAALLQEPYNRFFKVGVASAGNHDNNIYNQNWAERWHGLREVPASRPGAESRAAQSRPGSRASEQGSGEVRQGSRQGGRRGGRRGGDEADLDDDGDLGDATLDVVAQESRQTQGNGQERQTGAGTKFEIKVPTNAELAAGLQGHLLLVHGEIDNNVHPANTMRLVDALIRANKRFDLLIIPGARHSFGAAQGYFQQRMFEYFVQHLLGETPRGADILRK